jgi:hypothetical protein
MTELRSHSRRVAWLAVAAIVLLGTAAAHADMILSSSGLIQGTANISTVGYSFDVSGPGVLTIDLSDITVPNSAWESPLADLGVTATTPSGVLGQLSGAGQETFDITSGGAIYAYVTGKATNPATGPAYGIGLYNLNISFVPSVVPLPPSLGLLLAALLGFALLQPRLRRQRGIPALLP